MLPIRAAPPCIAASTADRPLARVLRSMLDRRISEARRLSASLAIDASGAARAVPSASVYCVIACGRSAVACLLVTPLRPLLSQVSVASTAGVRAR